MRTTCGTLAVVIGLAVGSAARADEEKVPLDKLPAKVTDAVKARFKGAELVSASKETEDGKLLYEVKIKSRGRTVEVTATEDGTIVEVEREITARELPKRVTQALNAKYKKATIQKAETVTKGGKTGYEVLIVTADKKKLEIKYDANGKVLEQEDKTGKKDEDDDKRKDAKKKD